jgi:ATP-dependent RNA helicase DDX52/ROK1
MSTFSLLASGASFSSRHRDDRRLFGASAPAASTTSAAASVGALGGLDFFGSPTGEETATSSKKKKKKAKAADVESTDEAAEPASAVSVDAMTEREVADANALRRAMRIHTYGTGVPAPVQSAEQMADSYALRPWLRRNILKSGYHELTRVQMQAVPLLLGGREVLACAPTGSGKTAAFLIPMLSHLGGLGRRQGLHAIAVAPTQELARQTHRELLKLAAGSGIEACVLTKKLAAAAVAQAERGGAPSGGGGEQGAASTRAVGSVWRKFDAMVCTPLRLVGLLRKGALSLSAVKYLVLDEADKLLELGFLEQVDEILATCSGESVQRALFSATMQPQIEDLVHSVLHNPVKVVVGDKNAAATTVEQKLVFCGREDGKMLALRQIVRGGIKPPVLIFVQSVERATQLFHELVYDGLNVDVLHAERSQAQRDLAVQKFRTGKVWVLIATELVARGMDFKGVSLVINCAPRHVARPALRSAPPPRIAALSRHWVRPSAHDVHRVVAPLPPRRSGGRGACALADDFPQSTTSYIHRIGRTGRAGRAGRAITFFTETDAEQLRAIANVMKASGCEVADWMLRMKPLAKDVRRRRSSNPISRKAIGKRPRDDPQLPVGGDAGGEDGDGPRKPPRKKRRAKQADDE